METKDAGHFKAHYEEGKYTQPAAVLRDQPDEKYFLAWARFVYAQWCGGSCCTFPSGLYQTRTPSELRMYARGIQSVEKYRDRIDVQIKDGTILEKSGLSVKGDSLLNISWDNWRFYPKYRALAISSAMSADYAPTVRATDTLSAKKRRDKYAKAKLAADPRMKALVSQAGVVPPDVQQYQSLEPTDVDTLMETGGFALDFEAIMEDVAGCTLDLSDWREIQRQMVEDRIDLGMMACVAETNVTEKRVRLKYVDAASAIAPVSRYHDHRTDTYRAFIERTNLSTIRQESGMDEKAIWAIAKSYSTFGTNSKTKSLHAGFNEYAWREEFQAKEGSQVYDHFSVDVMHLWFIANKVESMVVGVNPDGSTYAQSVNNDYELSGQDIEAGFYKKHTPVQYVYRVKWIVGTDKVYGWGIDDVIVREGENGCKRAVLPLLLWGSDEPSMTDNCISIIDDVQTAVLKIRLLVASLPPGPRMLIDMSVLDDSVAFGEKTYDMKSMLKLFGATGKLLVRTRSEFGVNEFNASNKNPIVNIEGGVQEDFNLFSGQIAFGLDMIRQVTGLNELSDGTGSPNDVLNGVAKGFQAATNNALRSHTAALEGLYKTLVRTIIARYQSLALYGRVHVNQWPVDATTLAVLTLPEDIAQYDFDVMVRVLPNEDDIQLMISQVLTKQQEMKISESDVFILMNLLGAKDVKKAQIFLARACAAGEKRIQEQQMAAIQAQAQANAQSAAATEQAKQGTIAAEQKGLFSLAEQKAMLDEQRAGADHERKKEIVNLEASLGLRTRVVEHAMAPQNLAQ